MNPTLKDSNRLYGTLKDPKRPYATLIPLAVCAVSLFLGGCLYQKVRTAPVKHFDAHLSVYANAKTGVQNMAKNKEYCRPVDGGKSYELAPMLIFPKTSVPTEAEYNAAGWYWNGIQPPEPPEGKVVETTTYRVDTAENMVVADYTYVDAPPPSLEEYDAAMEDFLRQEREERGYTTREPDSYLTSNVPRWAADARDWVNHRDAVMEYALNLINEVKEGKRLPPTMEEFLANMPKIHWSYELD